MIAPARIFNTPLAESQTATFSFHGTCRNCNHWHDRVPWTVSNIPDEYNGVRCLNCHSRMFGIGGSSIHPSLASRETLIFRSSTCSSNEASEPSLPEPPLQNSLLQLMTAIPAFSIHTESINTHMAEDDDPTVRTRGRDKGPHISPSSPTPGLLSPVSFTPTVLTRERSHSAPPPASQIDQPQQPGLRRGSSFKALKAELKKGVRKAINHMGYDVVRINSPPKVNINFLSSPEDLPTGATPPVPPSDALDTLVNPSEVPLPRSPETIIQPSEIQMPTYRHRFDHRAPPQQEIVRKREMKTIRATRPPNYQCEQGCECEGQSISPVTRLASSAEQIPSDHTSVVRSLSNTTTSIRSMEEIPRSFIDQLSGAANSFERAQSGASPATMSLESFGGRSMSTERLSASNRASGDRMSTASTALNSSRWSVSDPVSAPPSAPDLLHSVPSPRVALAYPYPPRISTDLSNLSDHSQTRFISYGSDIETPDQEDGGLTPVAAGGRRSSIIPNPVTPDDICNDRNRESAYGQSRSSIDAASVTSTHGSVQARERGG